VTAAGQVAGATLVMIPIALLVDRPWQLCHTEVAVNDIDVKSYSTEQARWEALVRRDEQASGLFVYGVVTTGVYCRPGCASRLPNRGNVRFFDTHQEAERAGFRPCKRCNPRSSNAKETYSEAIVQACKLIEESETPPSLADLASAVGLSPSYLHRVFKRMVGLTPKQYAMEKRADRVRANLQNSPTVTEAIYEAGFDSSSRFYENVTTTLGMKPSTYRKGGQGMHIRFAVARCSLS
jgi:AraC family transcriptional regulator of adaptative response/methylated-DNA-[protein]-cysteine methyltransferase